LPIPLHRLKERERGYNQALCLCQGIARATGIRLGPPLLRRDKYTVSQIQLSLEERKANVGDAFKVQPQHAEHVKEKTIVLVDDVITTGSTINACAKVLIEAGTKCVFAASAAVAK
jgi:ComF family protein